MQPTYAKYKDIKKTIRFFATVDIQRMFRGFRVRKSFHRRGHRFVANSRKKTSSSSDVFGNKTSSKHLLHSSDDGHTESTAFGSNKKPSPDTISIQHEGMYTCLLCIP